MADDKLYYVGVKAFIEKNGKILVLNDPKIGLDFPGGKIQQGESDFIETLKREVREETGFEIEVGEPFAIWEVVFPPNPKYVVPEVFLVGFKCKYLSGEFKISHEHDSFKWVDKSNYQIVKQDCGHYRALERYFSLKK